MRHLRHRRTRPRASRVGDDAGTHPVSADRAATARRADETQPVPAVRAVHDRPTEPVPVVRDPDTADPLLPQDRFRLQGRIGAGNHGVVFRARDAHLGRDVAVKRFSHYLADDPRAMRRITREVETLARISHPHVVTIHDLVQMPDGDGEITPHLVMELVEGTSLRDLLAARGPSVRSVVAVQGVLEGLAACHRAGVLHLDIKPANVLVTIDGGVKIVDFGIARAASDATATIAGTPHYMAPEQYDGRADERSDVYSVGCLLYECLTGRAPFEGTMAAQLLAHRSQPRPDPREHAADVGAALADVVVRAMAIEPDERFASVGAMHAALAEATGGPVAVPLLDSSPATSPSAPLSTTTVSPAAVVAPTSGPPSGSEAAMVRPLSRPGELAWQRPDGGAGEPAGAGRAAMERIAGGAVVTRWTRLTQLAIGLALSGAVVCLLPVVVWGATSLVPAENRPPFMEEYTADTWWMVAVGLALLFLVLRRDEFFPRLAGPPVGDPLPEGPVTADTRSGVAMAAGGALRGSAPMLLPAYVALLHVGVVALGIAWPSDPFGSTWVALWVFAPLATLLLGMRALSVIRPRFTAVLSSVMWFMLAGLTTAYFVVGAATFV